VIVLVINDPESGQEKEKTERKKRKKRLSEIPPPLLSRVLRTTVVLMIQRCIQAHLLLLDPLPLLLLTVFDRMVLRRDIPSPTK